MFHALQNKMKQPVFLFMLTCAFASVVSGSQLSKDNIEEKKQTVYTTELQSTSIPICNNKTDLTCPANSFQRGRRIDFCGFSCPEGTSYRCKEDKNHGIIEFCAKSEICEKGWMNNVYFDADHQRVVVQKQICPEEYYQPKESNCYTACTSTYLRHVDEKFLPQNGVEVLYHGNNTHPGVGYCDIDSGFVNEQSKMYFDITQYEISHCDKLDIKCPAGQRLLPDSTCVPECEEGFFVDRYNFFKCSMKSTRGDSSITIKLSTRVPKVNSDSGISLFKHITTQATISTTAQGHSAGYTAAVSIACVLGMAVVFFIVWRVWKRFQKRKSNPRKKNQERGTRKMRKREYDRCYFHKFGTKNGDVIVHIDSETAIKAKLKKKSTFEDSESDQESAIFEGFEHDGEQLPAQSENESTISIESGYSTVGMETVNPVQLQPLKSMFSGSRQEENNDETEVLKPCTN